MFTTQRANTVKRQPEQANVRPCNRIMAKQRHNTAKQGWDTVSML